MSVKIRLARHGRKHRPFYHIVVADSRAPRDGRFIERIGSYNPMTNPATVDLDVDKAIDWMYKGAQPTLTVRRILSYKGVLLKRHLLLGVKKGAITMEEAERRFSKWLEEKEAKIEAKRNELLTAKERSEKARIEQETKINEARKEAINKKRREEAEALAAAAAEAKAEQSEQAAPAEGESAAE